MKYTFLLSAVVALLAACQPSVDEQAAAAVQRVDSLFAAQDYNGTLQAINALRRDHPKAVEARRHALKVWQEASLRLTQQDVARTDSALQLAEQQLTQATNAGQKTKARLRRDSLQVRYDVLCALVRVIHRRQAEGQAASPSSSTSHGKP